MCQCGLGFVVLCHNYWTTLGQVLENLLGGELVLFLLRRSSDLIWFDQWTINSVFRNHPPRWTTWLRGRIIRLKLLISDISPFFFECFSRFSILPTTFHWTWAVHVHIPFWPSPWSGFPKYSLRFLHALLDEFLSSLLWAGARFGGISTQVPTHFYKVYCDSLVYCMWFMYNSLGQFLLETGFPHPGPLNSLTSRVELDGIPACSTHPYSIMGFSHSPSVVPPSS